MSSIRVRLAVPPAMLALLVVLLSILGAGCGGGERPLLPKTQTWAELRVVRREVRVGVPNEPERAPYPRERLVDGASIRVEKEGLAWVRRDGGATLLVRGPAELVMRSGALEIASGRLFVDTPPGVVEELVTPGGPLHLANVRASLDVGGKDATTEAYVLAGEVRTAGAARATAGERLVLRGKGDAAKAEVGPVLVWEDWTGGLATTDRTAEPAPYGVGTVGARRPGDQGAPRFPLAIQKLDVRVTIDGDFAVTEVDEVFFNASSETVEGIYRFRTPEGAILHRFGVDRDGVVVWGRVKEKQQAAAQYQANVYQGSKEDPALLEWDAPGVYRARLYPIGPGASRRVVVRYAEWLGRTGARGERRLWVYPMAAEGGEGSLPVVEELTARIELAKAGAKEVRVGMAGVRDGDTIVVREQDFTPRADLAVELFDDGPATARGVSAKHQPDLDVLPPSERGDAQRNAKNEPDYVLVPIRAPDAPLAGAGAGLDFAIVLDTSAATDGAALAIARAAAAALLTHLGPADRVAVWAGDSTLRPVAPGTEKLAGIDEARRRDILTRLAAVERGGATDLGAMISQAAAALDPARRGAVVYIGDGAPTVGELAVADLRDRMAKLPRPVRIFGLGVGDAADMGILKGLARGAFAERIGDANAAARAALRLLEHAERPVWLGANVDLGPAVERIFPRDLGALAADESAIVVGRLAGRAPPSSVRLTGPGGERTMPLQIVAIDDLGDLRRRWAEGRLAQMVDEGVGRAAMVDLGARYGIITPVTSLYVPTRNEMTSDEVVELERRRTLEVAKQKQNLDRRSNKYDTAQDEDRNGRFQQEAEEKAPWGRDDSLGSDPSAPRAKGEEGSMGRPSSATTPAATATAAAPPPQKEPADTKSGGGKPASAPVVAAAPPPPPPPEPPGSPLGGAYRVPAEAPNGAPAQALAEARTEIDAPKPAPSASAGEVAARGRAEALKDAEDFGMIGLLAPGADGKPADPWGDKTARPDPNAGYEIPPADQGVADNQPAFGAGLAGDTTAEPTTTIDSVGAGFGSGHGRLGGKHKTTREDLEADLRQGLDLAKNADGTPAARTSIVVRFGDVPHLALMCGAAAAAPLEERVGLWRERLARVAGNAHAVAAVYRRALFACEAPTFRERGRLLSLLLDAMPNVAGRVALWRVMFGDLGAADTLYRGILARVRTPQDMRALHQALGLRAMDPGLLAKALAEAKTPEARVTKLRGFVAIWPEDFALALKLLDALEDAGDDPGAREVGRALRARPDVDARVRTAVGELYLRLAARAQAPEQKAADEAEARRAFGEIVEFSPDDPVARRRLGDLLRAHGWHAEAARQYETLQRLAPDDASVPLLLAAAAQGLGKLEEAVKWTEKGGAAGAPDAEQSAAHTARAIAATYLAWGRLEAKQAGRTEEAKTLRARLLRVRSGEGSAGEAPRGTRAALTWEHPELHPTLWSNALGAPMPAPEGDVTLGIAQVMLPDRDGAFVEVRIEPDELEHAARLGATAILTVVFAEAEEQEAIVKLPVRFERGGSATRRFSVRGGEVREVSP